MNTTEEFFLARVQAGHIRVWKNGRVFNVKTRRFIGALGSGGYPKVTLSVSRSEIHHIQTHRLVWLCFSGPIPEGYQINHKDGDKLNPALKNLELATPSENMVHAVRKELLKPAVGSNNGFSRLTEKDVALARKTCKTTTDVSTLAKQLGVHYMTLAYAVTGKTWNVVRVSPIVLVPSRGGRKPAFPKTTASLLRLKAKGVSKDKAIAALIAKGSKMSRAQMARVYANS